MMRCGCDPQRRLMSAGKQEELSAVKAVQTLRSMSAFDQRRVISAGTMSGRASCRRHLHDLCMTGLSTFVNSARDIKRPVRLPRPSCSDPNPRQEGGCRIPSWTQILSILLGDHCRLGRWKWSLRPGVLGDL